MFSTTDCNLCRNLEVIKDVWANRQLTKLKKQSFLLRFLISSCWICCWLCIGFCIINSIFSPEVESEEIRRSINDESSLPWDNWIICLNIKEIVGGFWNILVYKILGSLIWNLGFRLIIFPKLVIFRAVQNRKFSKTQDQDYTPRPRLETKT